MRPTRLASAVAVASLLLAPLSTQVVPGAAAASRPASAAPTAGVPVTKGVTNPVTSSAVARTAERKKHKPPKPPFEPKSGPLFNDPMTYGSRRVIISKIVKSIENTAKGERVRVVTWNFDDRPATRALIHAKERGVVVQVIVSGAVDNDNWDRLARALNHNKKDRSFALQCSGGCRSDASIMHSKFYLFSRVHSARHITMVGSANLTTPAGNRQWNDLVTTRVRKVYRYLSGIFDQYARNKSVKDPFETATRGDFKFWIYPVGKRNPQLSELEKVRCKGATGGTGVNGRTKVRVAVAGWFDAYGEEIAQRLRHMWDHGCDVRVVTTLAGRGVNRALKATTGRGPVPQRELSMDRNYDGIPDRYLHQKSVAISGVYGHDHSASVVFTGSPNWSARAARSEEVWMRVLGRKGFTRRYMNRVDHLYASPYSTARSTTPAQLRRAVAVHARTTGRTTSGTTAEVTLPDWLELD